MFNDVCFSFSHFIWSLFLTIGCRPCGKAGASVHLEKTRFRLEGVSNLAFRPFACTAKKHRNKAETEKRKHAKNTIRTAHGRKTKNIIFKIALKIDPKTHCFALGARFRARSTPRRVQGRFWETPGTKRNFGRAQKRPKEISQSFFAPLKTYNPPRWGGGPFSAPAFWHPFLENRCWRLGGVQKSRSPGFQGPLLGLGGEAKASPTTSKLVV